MEAKRALMEATKEIGIKALKPKQEEAILAFMAGNDTFVSLPTGYGKSLIYGILPLMFDKVRGELVSTHNSHTPSNLSNSLTDIVLIFSILHRMQWKHCTMHQSSNFHHDGSESQILTSRHYH